MTDVPAAWKHPVVMGKDFWTCQCVCDALEKRIPGVSDLPSIKESALHYYCTKRIGLPDWRKAADYPKSYIEPFPADQKRTTPYKVTDLTFGPKTLAGAVKPDRPFFISYRELRPAFFLRRDGYPLADREDYAKWRAAHPNFLGLHALDEFDSDSNYFRRFYDTVPDEGVKAAYPKDVPDDGCRAVDWAKTAIGHVRALFFGEKSCSPMCSNQPSFAHIFAAAGATCLGYEATTQSYPSWQVAAAYTRGASRQFGGLPILWYTANYYGGYSRDGKAVYGENGWRPKDLSPGFQPHRGSSRSLLKRQSLHGWLVGATFLQTEHWDALYAGETNGVTFATPEGLDFEEVYQLSKRIDRGIPVTPLAVLTPVTDPMYTSGLFQNARDRFTPTAIFHTLVPIGYTGGLMRKEGEQGCLFNSPFADLCDVVAPDAGQDHAALVKALSAYPYAILAGTGFHRDRLDVAVLEEYVRGGGTLVVSADQIGEGYVTADMCGLELTGETVDVTGSFTDRSGAAFPLKDEYRVLRAKARGAKELLKVKADGLGLKQSGGTPLPLCFVNACGKGRVITIACAKGLPVRYADSPRMKEDRYYVEFRDITANVHTFEIYRWILNRIQSERLPIAVEGSAQWGVNEVEVQGRGRERSKENDSAVNLNLESQPSRWLVYLFNNKGVVKFSDEPEEFDLSKTSTVTVDARRLGEVRFTDAVTGEALEGNGGRISFRIKPGDYRLVEVVHE